MANPAAEAHARVLAAHPEAVVVERGRYHIKHRLADAPNGRPRYVLDCWIPPISGGAPDTVDKQVATSGDDGFRCTGTDGFSSTPTSHLIGYHSGAAYLHCHMFARWPEVSIEGTIDVSYVECYQEGGAYLTPQLKVYGVDEDDPAAPTSAAEFDADPLTDAAVDWDGAWTASNWAQSPSLNAIFQELVDTYTISNEAVMVQVKNDGGTDSRYNQPRHYDYAGNVSGPKLHIEYSTGAVDATITATTATATAVASVPTITAVKNVVVSAVAGVATAAALLASVLIGADVVGEAATATAAALTPTVAAVQNVTIAGEATTATADALTPTISTELDAVISAATATATAATKKPFAITDVDGTFSCHIPIDVGSDDGELWSDLENWSKTTWFMELGQGATAGDEMYGWWRWCGVPLPKNADLQEAKIRFRAWHFDNSSIDLLVEGCDEDDSAALTSWADYVSRDKTSDVAWNNVETWTATQWYYSPDIKAILTTVTAREGWSSGNAIQVIVKGTGQEDVRRDPGSYNGGAYYGTNYAAELYLQWETGTLVSAVTATAGAATLLPTIPNVVILGEEATASATALAPTIITGVAVEVSAEEAVASATAQVPTIETGVEVSGEAAIATAAALTPTVSVIRNVEVAGEEAVAAATGLTPTVSTAQDAEVAGEVAAATAEASVPVIIHDIDVEVAGEEATATATAPSPGISAGATVSAQVATATAAAPSPTARIGKSITAAVAIATGAAPVPSVSAGATIAGEVATATATAPNPTVAIGEAVISTTAVATAEALTPTIVTTSVVEVSGEVAAASAAALSPVIVTDIVYTQFGKIIAVINPDDYPTGTTLKLLTVVWTSDAAKPVYAQLYNVTDSVVETESIVNTDSESPVEVLSAALSLPSGDKTYRIEVGGIAGGTYYCAKAVVRGTT